MHYCSVPFEVRYLLKCVHTVESSKLKSGHFHIYRTVYCGPNSVLNGEVSLYRTAYCGPNGVLIIEVSLYRTAYCGPNGVLIIEVSLYRTAYCGPNGVLIIEVSLYRTTYTIVCITNHLRTATIDSLHQGVHYIGGHLQ